MFFVKSGIALPSHQSLSFFGIISNTIHLTEKYIITPTKINILRVLFPGDQKETSHHCVIV